MFSLDNTSLGNQRGAASMTTVAMFTLVFAIVAVGFTFLTISTLHNSTNKSQESMAKQAAETGLEDAKRILARCISPTDDVVDACAKINNPKANIDSQSCNEVISAMGGVLGNVSGDEVKIGASGTSYECLKITAVTDAINNVSAVSMKTDVYPLKVVNGEGRDLPVNEVPALKIEWHKLGGNGDGNVDLAKMPENGEILNANDRRNISPAIIRIERVLFNPLNTSSEKLIAGDSAITLIPSRNGDTKGRLPVPSYGETTNGQANFEETGINTGPTSRQPVKCGNSGMYACSFVVDMPQVDWKTFANRIGGSHDFSSLESYFRVTVIYGNATSSGFTNYKISLVSSDGSRRDDLRFKRVQPEAEVTGKAGDSRSRLRASFQINYTNDYNGGWLPENAIETNGGVCKDLNVYHDSAQDSCAY